jgi:uncharacterized protein YdhG (YjbR/CyaY superfamily)
MQSSAKTVQEYLDDVPANHKEAILQLRKAIFENLPPGFEECMSYGMIGYVVPLSLYPSGYHCDKELPLPFINLASQKNFIALYHMGLYAEENFLQWFKEEYAKRVQHKLDMGKSCIRFKKTDQIPYDLIAELCSRISPEEWIRKYEEKWGKGKEKK